MEYSSSEHPDRWAQIAKQNPRGDPPGHGLPPDTTSRQDGSQPSVDAGPSKHTAARGCRECQEAVEHCQPVGCGECIRHSESVEDRTGSYIPVPKDPRLTHPHYEGVAPQYQGLGYTAKPHPVVLRLAPILLSNSSMGKEVRQHRQNEIARVESQQWFQENMQMWVADKKRNATLTKEQLEEFQEVKQKELEIKWRNGYAFQDYKIRLLSNETEAQEMAKIRENLEQIQVGAQPLSDPSVGLECSGCGEVKRYRVVPQATEEPLALWPCPKYENGAWNSFTQIRALMLEIQNLQVPCDQCREHPPKGVKEPRPVLEHDEYIKSLGFFFPEKHKTVETEVYGKDAAYHVAVTNPITPEPAVTAQGGTIDRNYKHSPMSQEYVKRRHDGQRSDTLPMKTVGQRADALRLYGGVLTDSKETLEALSASEELAANSSSRFSDLSRNDQDKVHTATKLQKYEIDAVMRQHVREAKNLSTDAKRNKLLVEKSEFVLIVDSYPSNWITDNPLDPELESSLWGTWTHKLRPARVTWRGDKKFGAQYLFTFGGKDIEAIISRKELQNFAEIFNTDYKDEDHHIHHPSLGDVVYASGVGHEKKRSYVNCVSKEVSYKSSIVPLDATMSSRGHTILDEIEMRAHEARYEERRKANKAKVRKEDGDRLAEKKRSTEKSVSQGVYHGEGNPAAYTPSTGGSASDNFGSFGSQHQDHQAFAGTPGSAPAPAVPSFIANQTSSNSGGTGAYGSPTPYGTQRSQQSVLGPNDRSASKSGFEDRRWPQSEYEHFQPPTAAQMFQLHPTDDGPGRSRSNVPAPRPNNKIKGTPSGVASAIRNGQLTDGGSGQGIKRNTPSDRSNDMFHVSKKPNTRGSR